MRPRIAPALSFLLLLWSVPVAAQPADPGASAPEWQPLEEAVQAARLSGKKVLIDVYAPWCGVCQRMQREVYTDAEVQQYLERHFEIARLNGDDGEKTHAFRGVTLTASELAFRLGARGYPTTVFLQSDGAYITRLPGFADASAFLDVLRYVGTDAYREQSFREFTEQ